jgi:hypothetical protein
LPFFIVTNLYSQESKIFNKAKDIKGHGFSKQKLDTLVSFLETSGTSSLLIISDKKPF